MSGDLKEPSKSIPKGTLWATLTTFIVYFVVVLSMASSTTHASLVANPNVIPLTNLSQPIIFGGECAVTAFSTLMGIKSAAGMFRALAKDKLLPGFSFFDKGMGRRDVPILSLLLTYAIAQVALLADLNQIATLISMGFQVSHFMITMFYHANDIADDLLRHELGVLLLKNRRCSKFSAKLQILQLANRFPRKLVNSCSDVFH